MKKFLAALMFVGLASASQAATINLTCSPNPLILNGASGGGIETCDLSPLAGATINSVSAFLLFDIITDQPTGASATFSFTGLAGLNFAGTATTEDRPKSTNLVLDATQAFWTAGGSYIITDSYIGNDVVQGGLFTKTITVDYTSGVPEPGSMALLGSGLVGLGLLARRRKRS